MINLLPQLLILPGVSVELNERNEVVKNTTEIDKAKQFVKR